MKNILMIVMALFIGTSMAQEAKEPKVKKVSFKTSAICGECKERIEDALNYTKGVVYAELDLETKIITVKFKTKKINSMMIKKVVSDVGYDAGEVPRNDKTFEELPKCCKSEGHCKRG